MRISNSERQRSAKSQVVSRCGLRSQPHAAVQANGETLLATTLAPQNAAVWQARAKVLTALRRASEAAAAAKIPAELPKQ